MSNKTLVISIVAIVLICAGIVFGVTYYHANAPTTNNNLQNTSSNTPSSISLTNTDTQTQQATTTSVVASTTPLSKTKSSTSTPTSMTTCQRNFDQNKLTNDKVVIQNRQVTITVKDFGPITVELYDKDAPKTVENFLRLTNSGYYNCLTFHRVSRGFVIQGGDPTGTGSGGDSAFGGPFADELDSNTPSAKAGYVKGVLAMANAGPNTNTSQFFIMLDNVSLPHNYTIFGKVISGQNVVDKIGQVDITPQMGSTDGKPVTPVVMESVKITK